MNIFPPPRLVFTISAIEDQYAELLGQAYDRSCALAEVAEHTDYVKALTLCQYRSDNENLSEEGVGHWFPAYASDWMCKNTRLFGNPKWESIYDRDYEFTTWMVLSLIRNCLTDNRFRVEQKVIVYQEKDFVAWSDQNLEFPT